MKAGGSVSRWGFVRSLAVLGILALLAAPTVYLYRAWAQVEHELLQAAHAHVRFMSGQMTQGGLPWRQQVAAAAAAAGELPFEGRWLVRDAQGLLLVAVGAEPPAPAWSVSVPLPVAPGMQAELEVIRSAKPLLWHVLGVGSLTLALGGLIALLSVQGQRRSRGEPAAAGAVTAAEPPAHVSVAVPGLLNRTGFTEQLRLAIERSAGRGMECTVFHLDLDHFKSLNGMVGLNSADALLIQVAESVCQRVKLLTAEAGLAPAVIAAPGGDVFLVLVEGLPRLQHVTEAFARGVLESLSHVFEIGSHQIYISACIGISHLGGRPVGAQVLLREAELAKSHAKRQGSGSYAIHNEEMEAQAHARDVMGYELRRALADGEFQLHYQPKVHLVTGAVTGVEALLRWQPAERPMVMPDQFVPVLEDTGLIVPVGAWVLRQACVQLMDWRRRGMPPISVAVNVSARQLQQRGFVDTVEQVLQETGMEARYLELELTESIFIENGADNVRTLRQLAAAGVSLAIDDFGTGHSSLSYLRNFSPRTLKIDRSFLSEMPDDADNIAIARAIIALGHGLGLHVVAEGVETEAQAEFLRGYGCDQMQGYLLSRPQNAERMEAWLWEYLKERERVRQDDRMAVD